MESFFSRFKNALVLIAILLAMTVALATQINRPVDPLRPDGRQVRLVRLWASAMISPFERMSAAAGRGVRGAWANYVSLRNVRQQNAELQKQIAALRVERAALAEDALLGKRLSALLEFRQHYVSSTVVAQVIGTSGSDQSRLLTLDKGAKDGLHPGMPVITPDGIVGKLRDVFPGTAQLLLINDPTSGAGVMLQTTRIRGILHGTPQGRVVINNLTADARIKTGEAVLTSGGDQVFPRGLPVGTIESIVPDLEHQPYTLITLKPAANLNQLEEVLIITATGTGMDPATQQELATDVATHAADVGADRLPSLHDKAEPAAPTDPNAPPAPVMPPPANSTDLVPKPKPALQPDRYSPGTAPPAAELTPGAPRR
jgi:rod shape-determining protein MreC